MEFLTSTILAGIAYDLIKNGTLISLESLKNKLKGWLISDENLKILSQKINNIDNLDDLSEKAISKQLEQDTTVTQILANIQQDKSANIITQTHFGSGDNVGGDKIINQAK